MPLVAEKLGMRWASSAVAPMSFFSAYDPPVFGFLPILAKLSKLGLIFNQGVISYAKFITKFWAKPIIQLCRELGLPKLLGNPLIDKKFSPYLVVALFSSVLAPQPDWAANTVMAGFTFYDGTQGGAELVPELKQFLDAGEPPLIFTLGSAAVMAPGNFYQESIAVAKLLDRRAVLLMGKNTPPDNLSKDILASYAPCSSRIISRKHYVAPRVAKELQELLDNPSYAANAAEIGRIIQAENGVKVACDAIEKQLQVVSVLPYYP